MKAQGLLDRDSGRRPERSEGSAAFVADAPLDEWDKNWPIFEAMLESLRFGAK